MKKALILIALIFLLPHALFAGGAMDHVRTKVDKVLNILTDPQYTSEKNKKDQKAKLVQAGEELFDFTEVTRLSVGKYWKKFSTQEKIEFRDLFSQLLQKTYMDKIIDYKGEKIMFDKEIQLSSSKTEVDTHILRNGQNVPVSYKLRFKKNEWRVYDVIVEGVSLVKNYRSQFRSILAKNPPRVLMDRVKKKIEQPTNQG